jgi:hypothetical protein
MPSTSKSQYKFFQTVKGVKSGNTPKKDVSKEVVDAAENMNMKQIDDFLNVDFDKLKEQKLRSTIRKTVIKEYVLHIMNKQK